MDAYSFAATTPYGTGPATLFSPGTGDPFGIAFAGGPALLVPETYAGGDLLAFTLSAPGESFASLGITPVPVSITAGENTINLSFSTASAIPLPPAGLLLAGAMGALLLRRRG